MSKKENGKPAYVPWQHRLQDVIDQHNRQAMHKPKVISGATMADRAKICFLAFNQLHEAGYRIEDPHNLKPKHIEFLLRSWEEQGLSASTLAKRTSVMRALCEWLGKPGMVPNPEKVLADPKRIKRVLVAKTDKSWSTKGIDPNKLIAEIAAYDPNVGMQLAVIQAFGLRRKEGVMMKPHRADKGLYLSVHDGTKGGRHRIVPIDTPEKREVIDRAKVFVGPSMDRHLGHPGSNLEQELNRYSYVLRRFGISKKELGVTGHGLRAEYLNNRYEEIAGAPSPVRRQGQDCEVDPEKDRLARMITTEEAGHSRLNITGAYYGGLVSTKKKGGEDGTAN